MATTHTCRRAPCRVQGTDTFTLRRNASEPGGWSCLRVATGLQKPTDMPFSMLAIDAGATFDGSDTIDGVAAERWVHARPKKGPLEAGNMTWHLAADARLLRTSYLHALPPFQPPSPTGLGSGERVRRLKKPSAPCEAGALVASPDHRKA